VAARGLDVDGIDRVINYELPDSPELFTHRSGRTGRMGRQGEVITFLTPADAPKWREIERAFGRRLPRTVWPHGHVAGPAASAATSARPASSPSPRVAATAPRPRPAGPRPAQRVAPAGRPEAVESRPPARPSIGGQRTRRPSW